MNVHAELADCLDALIKHLMHISEAEVVEALADIDLSFTQVRVMFMLAKVGHPMPINELAAHISQSVAAAGRNVDALVRLGLVKRKENPEDRRVKFVSVTPKGNKFVDRQLHARRATLMSFVVSLPHDQSRRLVEALRPIVTNSHRPITQQKENHV